MHYLVDDARVGAAAVVAGAGLDDELVAADPVEGGVATADAGSCFTAPYFAASQSRTSAGL
jgi:hypothetical protein